MIVANVSVLISNSWTVAKTSMCHTGWDTRQCLNDQSRCTITSPVNISYWKVKTGFSIRTALLLRAILSPPRNTLLTTLRTQSHNTHTTALHQPCTITAAAQAAIDYHHRSHHELRVCCHPLIFATSKSLDSSSPHTAMDTTRIRLASPCRTSRKPPTR